MQHLIIRLIAFSALTLALGWSAQASTTWTIDPQHSSAQFSVRHMMISNVKGEFSKVTGTVEYDGKDLRSIKVDATIDTTTVNTREPQRDAHLKSAEFFDVANYPTMTFKSKRVEQVQQGSFKLVGDMTIHGVTKEVVLDVAGPSQEIKDQRGNVHIGASATTKVNRKDFGLKWNGLVEGGGVVVGDEVSITLDLEFVRKA